MDIKELNKTQLILLTLLITFVVSIATGIITVSLMQQMPKSVPQTINNVIQRTIEKVTTEPAPTPAKTTDNTTDSKSIFSSDSDVVISIYPADKVATIPDPNAPPVVPPAPAEAPKALGEGIIVSDIGLVLVDSNILTEEKVYKVVLNKTDFDATVLKKFTNGFTILKITAKQAKTETKGSVKGATTDTTTPKVDKAQ